MILSPNIKYSVAKDGVSQSLLEMYMKCPRMFAIATHGYTFPTKFAMELGSYGHKCIEECEAELTDDQFKFDKTISSQQREQIRACMHAIIPSYFKKYDKSDSAYKFEPEFVFDVNYAGARLRGKIDAIWTHKQLGTICIKETKFKSRISEQEHDNALVLDWQSLFYAFVVALQRFKAPKGIKVIYDVVRYPTIRDDSNPKDIYNKTCLEIRREPERWFYRWETKYTAQDISDFGGELVQKLTELRERKIWYRNQCSCKGFFPCNFLQYCNSGSTAGLVKKPLFSELL